MRLRVRNEKLVQITFMSLASYATGGLVLGDVGACEHMWTRSVQSPVPSSRSLPASRYEETFRSQRDESGSVVVLLRLKEEKTS